MDVSSNRDQAFLKNRTTEIIEINIINGSIAFVKSLKTAVTASKIIDIIPNVSDFRLTDKYIWMHVKIKRSNTAISVFAKTGFNVKKCNLIVT